MLQSSMLATMMPWGPSFILYLGSLVFVFDISFHKEFIAPPLFSFFFFSPPPPEAKKWLFVLLLMIVINEFYF